VPHLKQLFSNDAAMKKDYAHEIDLLRFLAAVAVVIFHLSFRGHAADNLSPLRYDALAGVGKYGYLGVDLFFMISGFVIMMSAIKASAKSFVISRMARLYPAFWICCTVTFLAILTIGSADHPFSFKDYLVNMTMLGGFVYAPYLDGSYWSLTVEMHFYLLVAMVILLRKIQWAESLVIAWLVATMLLQIFPFSALDSLLIGRYSPYFIAGAMCYFIRTHGLSIIRLVTVFAAWLLALERDIGFLATMSRHYATSFDAAVVVAIITVFFIAMLLIATRKTGRLAEQQWALLGALTYPLYLAHQTIGYLLFGKLYGAINIHVLFWSVIVLMFGFSYLVNTQVERKLSVRMKMALTHLCDVFLSRSSMIYRLVVKRS
jgi:peptidoglycan/LPS O-acetylase OafA/YrhL